MLFPAPLVRLAGTTAPLASMIVFAAPLPTVLQVSRDRDVGTLPLLPYSCTVASAFVWSTYGILRREPKIWFTNVVGLGMALYFFFQFTKFAPKESSTLPGSVVQHLQSVLAIMVGTLMAAIAFPPNTVGTMGVILCIAMFASPLAALKTVLQTKSARSIPLPFTIAAITNCFLWSIVGVNMNDFNIVLPNTLGLGSGLVQLFLKMLYRNASGEVASAM